MSEKRFFTTGETAKLLNISLSTVSRKFDEGILFGKKNPITGERLISRESIVVFMEKYKLPLDAFDQGKKRILFGTPDEQFFSLVQKILLYDSRIEIQRAGFGCDVLIWCSKEHPDLLIIDEELPDIPYTEVIKSLRRMEEQKDLKILCSSKNPMAKGCLESGADGILAKDSSEEELVQKVSLFLNIPGEQSLEIQSFEHQRRWPRIPINLPAKIEVYQVSSPRHRHPGEALIENISYGGSYLSEIQIEKKIIPGEPFRFLVEANQPPLMDWRAHCKVVRLQSNGSLTAGVQFMRLSKANRKTVEAICQPFDSPA